MFQKKNERSLEAHRFKSLVSIKLFTWNTMTIMGIQDENIKSIIIRKVKHWGSSKNFTVIDWYIEYQKRCL